MIYGLSQQLPWNPEYRNLIWPVLQEPALLAIWPFCGYISFSIPESRGNHGTSTEVRRKTILCALRLIWDMLRYPELVWERSRYRLLSSCKQYWLFCPWASIASLSSTGKWFALGDYSFPATVRLEKVIRAKKTLND